MKQEWQARMVKIALIAMAVIWELRVEVSADGGVARWSSRVTAGGQVLSLSSGTVHSASG